MVSSGRGQIRDFAACLCCLPKWHSGVRNNETELCKGPLSSRKLLFSPLSLRFLLCKQEIISSRSETVTAKNLLQGA